MMILKVKAALEFFNSALPWLIGLGIGMVIVYYLIKIWVGTED